MFSTPSSEAASAAAARSARAPSRSSSTSRSVPRAERGLQPVVVRAVRGGDGDERLGGAARVAEAVGEVGAGGPVGDRVRAGALQRPPAPRDRARAVEAPVAVHRVLQGDRGRQLGIGVLAAGRPRPAQEGLRFGGAPGGHGERAEHAVALGPRREVGDLAAVRRRARRVAVLEHPGDGLEHAPLPVGRGAGSAGPASTRLAVAAGHAWRSASRRANGLQVGRERGVGDRRRRDPVPQHRRGLGRPTPPRRRAARCAGPRRASRAPPTGRAGAGRPRVTGVPGPGSARRPAAAASSSGASGSSSPANDATCGSGLCMPSTAAASTRSRAAAEQPDQRSLDDQPERTWRGQRPLPRAPTTAPGTRRAAPWRAAGCPGCRRAGDGRPPATAAIRAGPRGRAARARRARAARCAAPACPSTTRRRPSGSPVTASRTPIRTSTWSATSRRSANSSAERDGRSAQCASSTTTTTTASSPPRRRGRAAAAAACRR